MNDETRSRTGIPGLDEVLFGGLIAQQVYLIDGAPGAGKTTFALHYLLEGVKGGERCTYVTLSETTRELEAGARSHGWSLAGIEIIQLVPDETELKREEQLTMLPASEVVLGETTRRVLESIERSSPNRVVIDSLSELRLLAQGSLRYRRQILALKQFFVGRQCTVILIDDRTGTGPDLQLHSIAHGVIALNSSAPTYGQIRRELQVVKLRGTDFISGFHDFSLRKGGLTVYPRLVAAEHDSAYVQEQLPSGIAALDALMGGGIDRGTSTLLIGPPGSGKSTLALQYAAAALARGGHAATFIFDETKSALLTRCAGIGIRLPEGTRPGHIAIRQIDPVAISPGEFAHLVRQSVEHDAARVVIIDSLNGYLNSMPHNSYLTAQLHELLSYLNNRGVATFFTVAQTGTIGSNMTSPVDASYLADSVVLLRYFELAGRVRKAISVLKKRTGGHEDSIREMWFDETGVHLRPAASTAAWGIEWRTCRGRESGQPGWTAADRSACQLRDPAMDDFRVLLLAPTRRDREATLELLVRAKIQTTPCENADAVAREVDQSAGAILMTDDVFGDRHIDHLTAAIAQQPSWSDVPIILLFHSDPMRESTERVLDALRNVTLLDRPASSRTLVSSVRTALRARARQYQLRDQIQALRATESALREADRRKDLFLATLAHELRNPLAPIRTAAQVLASPTLAPQKIQWAQSVIQRQVRHMALLLDDLLDIARITRGKLELKRTHVALTEVVDAAVEAARPLIDDKKHHLTVRLPAEEPVLNADPLRLSQILSNLLTNAAKYTDPAGHIELAASLQGDSLLLTVKDDGIGIASNALKGIFDMFSQIDGASSRSDGGLGIGLSLVKGLVALHGGSIEAHSDGPGRGSEFAIRLPLAPHRASEQPADHGRVPAVAAGRRIMIVDDNKDAGDALAMLLELSNHDVRVAYSGRGALTLAHTFRPEVAFIDIGMPDLNGYEVAQALRLEPWGAQIRLVALTGWGQHDDRQRAKAAGFDLHITKPVDSGAIEPLLQ